MAKIEEIAKGEGWILTNPPYGVRVGEGNDLRDLYATLGKAMKTKRVWRLGVLTSDAVLAGQMRLGDHVVLEIASFTNPCKTIKASFTEGEFVRIAHKIYPGWSRVYARVLSEGEIHFGDPVEVNPATW